VSNFIGSRAAGFSGVAVKGWKLSPAGDLTVKVTNEVGQLITINSVNATIGANSSLNSTSIPLAVGEDSPDIVLGGFSPQTAGTGYTAKVVISYTDRSSDFDYSSSKIELWETFSSALLVIVSFFIGLLVGLVAK